MIHFKVTMPTTEYRVKRTRSMSGGIRVNNANDATFSFGIFLNFNQVTLYKSSLDAIELL